MTNTGKWIINLIHRIEDLFRICANYLGFEKGLGFDINYDVKLIVENKKFSAPDNLTSMNFCHTRFLTHVAPLV